METSQTLIKQLQSFKNYHGLNEYYIRKDIGLEYGKKRATNLQLKNKLLVLQTNINYDINEDILYTILLNSDVDNIKSLCKINKISLDICS